MKMAIGADVEREWHLRQGNIQLSLRNLELGCRRLVDDQIDPAPDSGQRAYSAVVKKLAATTNKHACAR